METVIPIADLQPIYSVADVDRARGDGAARRNEGLASWYDRMRELGGSRYIIKPSTVAAVNDLYDASPNFHAVIDDLRKYLARAVAQRSTRQGGADADRRRIRQSARGARRGRQGRRRRALRPDGRAVRSAR